MTGRIPRALAALLLACGLAAAGVLPAAAGAGGSRLGADERLAAGQELVSPSGQYKVVMQTDGNLVAYGNGHALWASDTNGRGGIRLEMQSDGNLVMYTAANAPVWESGTRGLGGTYAEAQDNGDFIMRRPDGSDVWGKKPSKSTIDKGSSLRAGWSLISDDGKQELWMQSDGNLVLYRGSTAVWATGTIGNPGAYTDVQTDGNVVVYAPGHRPLWSTRTSGRAITRLTVQDDGNVVLYNGASPVWESGTRMGEDPGPTTNDYPSPWREGALDQYVDSWGQYSRECTSFAAFRLSSRNGFTIPWAYGYATTWGTRAASEGRRVDMSPARGSIAWWSSGHVAWVHSVSGDSVRIEEYNFDLRGNYGTRVIPRTSVSGYIHFKDL